MAQVMKARPGYLPRRLFPELTLIVLATMLSLFLYNVVCLGEFPSHILLFMI